MPPHRTANGEVDLEQVVGARRDRHEVRLERTGRIVSAAAVLMCIALGTLAVSKIEYVKELGIGLAFAIIIDAMVVRPLLVPALMKLLGRWNWWAPAGIRALGKRFAVAPSGSER